jgi:hypothetical protein
MKHATVLKGKTIYYDYDEYQDALFVTFDKDPPLSYYEELEDGILIRRAAESDCIVGCTIRNVSFKVFEQYASVLSTL